MTISPSGKVRISLLAIPDVYMSSLSGLYDTFTVASDLARGRVDFAVDIVAGTERLESRGSGMMITANRTFDEAADPDIVIVPNMVANGAEWMEGRYPIATGWLRDNFRRGSTLCSACSGALLLAETGLLDGQEITTHWNLARTFSARFPSVRLRLEHEVVASGPDARIITSGASAAWHDLALHLIARFGGADLAYEAAKFFMFQWHSDGQALYVDFDEVLDHGDGAVRRAQAWLASNWTAPNPVEAMTAQSGLAERTFKRRFRNATGRTPIAYVQQLRVQHAKRMLAGSHDSIEAIGWQVGYEDTSAFRRLFKRITHVTPGTYRRKMKIRTPYGAMDS
ncbi:MAG TPA: helix-turn-helix domain-containing protein [Gemmatimonadaceae bacterium]